MTKEARIPKPEKDPTQGAPGTALPRLLGTALLSRKNSADDFLNRDFLDVDVGHLQFVEQGLADRDDPIALNFELDGARALRDDLAVLGQAGGITLGCSFAPNRHQFRISEPIHHFAQAAIEENRPVINDDDAFA